MYSVIPPILNTQTHFYGRFNWRIPKNQHNNGIMFLCLQWFWYFDFRLGSWTANELNNSYNKSSQTIDSHCEFYLSNYMIWAKICCAAVCCEDQINGLWCTVDIDLIGFCSLTITFNRSLQEQRECLNEFSLFISFC